LGFYNLAAKFMDTVGAAYIKPSGTMGNSLPHVREGARGQ